MKVVHKNQAIKFINSDVCSGRQYNIGDKDIDGAIININGRYPNKNFMVNLRCKELAYIIKGTGKVAIENQEFILQEGDLAFINKGEKYYWEGNMTMFMPCTPAWYTEQHKAVN
jgi:mannose-6-phosphate isomerase-like protein (cupin superfamily)